MLYTIYPLFCQIEKDASGREKLKIQESFPREDDCWEHLKSIQHQRNYIVIEYNPKNNDILKKFDGTTGLLISSSQPKVLTPLQTALQNIISEIDKLKESEFKNYCLSLKQKIMDTKDLGNSKNIVDLKLSINKLRFAVGEGSALKKVFDDGIKTLDQKLGEIVETAEDPYRAIKRQLSNLLQDINEYIKVRKSVSGFEEIIQNVQNDVIPPIRAAIDEITQKGSLTPKSLDKVIGIMLTQGDKFQTSHTLNLLFKHSNQMLALQRASIQKKSGKENKNFIDAKAEIKDAGGVLKMNGYPNAFKCPYTLSVMENPVIDPTTGISYEKEEIVKYIQQYGKGPQGPLKVSELIENVDLKNLIQDFERQNKEAMQQTFRI